MADDERVSKESRQTFLSSFEGDVNQFLEASESEDNHPLTDVEITTDLGSSMTSVASPTSPMPNLARSMDGRKELPFRVKSPILERESPSTTSVEEQEESFSDITTEASAVPSWNPARSPGQVDTTQEDPLGALRETPAQEILLPHSDTPLPGDFKEDVQEEYSSDEITVHQDDSIDTEVLMQMAGVDSTTSGSVLVDSLEGITATAALEELAGGKEQLLGNLRTNESLLLDKVSFMESSATALVQNNTLMATGASLADLPLEEVHEQSKEGSKEEGSDNSFTEEIDKIKEEASERDPTSERDRFESDESSASSSRRINPLESTPILQDRPPDSQSKIDLSPVLSTTHLAQLSVVKEREEEREEVVSRAGTVSSNSDKGERTMEYYLAKIKAKAAQKSMEIRSSMESSKSENRSPSPVFVKPKTPAPKRGKSAPSVTSRGLGGIKKHVNVKSASSPSISRGGSVAGSRGRASKSKISAQSPVAAYINSGASSRGKKPEPKVTDKVTDVPKKDFGNTWTFDGSKSLVEAVQAGSDSPAWQELYKRSQTELRLVQEQLANTLVDHKERVKNVKTAHSQELHRVKQDVYLLQSKLKSLPASDAPTEEREAALQKQVQELETLLAGSQAENVRLYEETRVTKQHLKEEQTRLYLENKQLATENVSLTQLLENKESSLRQLQHQSQSLTMSNKVQHLPKLAELQRQCEDYKQREVLYEQRIAVLSESREGKEFTDAAVNSSVHIVDKQLGTLIKEHATERDQLYSKLEHLLKENSELLTDRGLLQRREERIVELQSEVKRLQSEGYKAELIAVGSKDSLSQIKDLKRQVSELESALHKRHPDSIAALIAATAPTHHKVRESELRDHLDTVKAEYESHIAKLKETMAKDTHLEVGRVEQLNAALKERVGQSELYRVQLEREGEGLKEQIRGLKEGQIPSGEIKRRIEALQGHIRTQEEELLRLRSKITEAERRPYNPEQFEGKHVSEWRKENSVLQTKLDLMKIESEQSKVTMSGVLTEKDNTIQRLKEEYQVKEEALLAENQASIQRLIADTAARHADSQLAKLHNKIETLELQVSHYSTVAKSVPSLEEEVKSVREKEKVLTEQLAKAGRELDEAQANAPPRVQQLRTLQHKLTALEQKHSTRVLQLEDTVHKLERSNVRVVVADETIINKYKEQLMVKNRQIEQFQDEMDTIISLCHELQQHGIVLPERKSLY